MHLFAHDLNVLPTSSVPPNAACLSFMLLLAKIITAVAIVATVFIVACKWGSIVGGTTENLNQMSTADQVIVDLLRKMSKEAGLPQVEVTLENVCLTRGCYMAAFDILSAMNASVDPCKDFFQYSCGRWLEINAVHPAASRWSRFNDIEDGVYDIILKILNEDPSNADARPIDQAKQYYHTCVELEGIEDVGLTPLTTIISEFGGWQLVNPGAWNNNTFDWIEAVGETRRRTLQPAIIDMHVSADIKNNTRSIVYIDQPEFGLSRGVLIAPENYTNIINAYEQYIVDVAKLLNATQTEAQIRASAKALINLEVALAKISSSDEDRYDMERIYNPFALKEYQSITDGIDATFTINWKKYLDQVFSSSGVNISNNEQIVVHELNYIRNLIPILAGEQQTTIANYIVWRLIYGLVPDTTAAMRNATLHFQQTVTGITQPASREITCAYTANAVFGMAIGAKFIQAAFDKDIKAEVESLVDDLLISFKEMVGDAEWMQNITKVEAIAKADAIRSYIAYPDWLENKTAVEDFYAGLELADTHFGNELNLALYRMDSGLKTLRFPTNRHEWIMYPVVVNAAYSLQFNSITFPAGILQSPFFDKIRPKWQNYAGIGTVIGHEITHGFDNEGAQFDKDGNAQNWWDDGTKAEFDRRAKCMSKQYSSFYAEAARLNVNGDLTLGENIADNGGLRQSYSAYQKYLAENGPEGRLPGLEMLTTDQLFFLGYANIWCESVTPEELVNEILTDPHSPAEFRVNGAVRNSNDFARAYSCPVDVNGMNPPQEDKCIVW